MPPGIPYSGRLQRAQPPLGLLPTGRPQTGTLLDWALNKDLTIMNDRAHTWVNTRARRDTPGPQGSDSGGKSYPDVSICGSVWSSKFTWKTDEPIGGSDHLLILITINERTEQQPIYTGQVRWKTTNVDWTAFTEEIEASIESTIESTMPSGESIEK